MFLTSRRNARLASLVALVLAIGQTAGLSAFAADVSAVASMAPRPTDMISAPKSVSGRLARTDAQLLGRNDQQMVNVVIKLDYDATASYAGRITGLAATSPRVTGQRLDKNAAHVQRYEAHIAGHEAAVVSA